MPGILSFCIVVVGDSNAPVAINKILPSFFCFNCGSIWADREYDLFQLRNMWGDAYGLYETYKEKCPLSEYTDFRVAYYASMHEAAMRLKGGLIMPLWEILNNARLKKEMKKLTTMLDNLPEN